MAAPPDGRCEEAHQLVVLDIGTASSVRAPAYFAARGFSVRINVVADVRDVDHIAALYAAIHGGAGPRLDGAPVAEMPFERLQGVVQRADFGPAFSIRNSVPKPASQMRVAFSSIALNTGFSSPGELEMTFSTSLVAVCCSSNSERSSVRWRSSLSSRAFSIAMTACAAKFSNSAICLSENGRIPLRQEEIMPSNTSSLRSGTYSPVRTPACLTDARTIGWSICARSGMWRKRSPSINDRVIGLSAPRYPWRSCSANVPE